ncbi:fluoroquinolone export ABC transporter permease subunit [Salinactinospora qingdaonensis]|uniref:Fluoroquinolone transport system permease protein n=1 Tax=Salinactinospora qingdaonensis TaxID=702744 RepID=A0ABP7FGC9_9ACTN
MTAPLPHAPSRTLQRVGAALALEVRLELRHGLVGAALGLSLVWSTVLLAIPATTAAALAPLLLFVDTAGFGALFAVVLALFERVERSRESLATTPLRPSEYIGARLTVLTVLSVVAAVPIVTVSTRDRWLEGPAAMATVVLPALVGVALSALLFLGAVVAAGIRVQTFQALFGQLPLVLVPLLAPALAHLSGLVSSPLLFLAPTTVAADLLHVGLSPEGVSFGLATAVLYPLAAVVAMSALATARLRVDTTEKPSAQAPPATVARPPQRRQRRPRTPAAIRPLAAFARVDLRGIGRDPTLLALPIAPVLLALGLRMGYPLLEEFVGAHYGVVLAPYRPVALAALVVLHVPLMTGAIGAMRAMEDVDDRTLLVLRVSPFSLSHYLAYRLLGVLGVTVAGLAVALPLSGLAGPWSAGLVVALLLAAAQAPLLVLLAVALASGKVQGLVTVKIVGAALTLLPLLVWWLPAPWVWLLAVLPPFWPVAAVPSYGLATAPLAGLLGTLTILGWAFPAWLGVPRRQSR